MRPRRLYLEIFLISFAALLLEISYTRIISFKLFYYFSYFVIGLGLLGFGSGGVFVALSSRLRSAPLEKVLSLSCILGGVSVGAGYFLVAYLPLNIWVASHSVGELGKLVLLGGALYASFLATGIMVASLLGRNISNVNRLYFADLAGAALGCAVAVPLISVLSPPSCVMLSGATLGVVGVRMSYGHSRLQGCACGGLVVLLVLGVVFPWMLPDPMPDAAKQFDPRSIPRDMYLFRAWSPVFRIDAIDMSKVAHEDLILLFHDGLPGSALHRFNGDVATLGRFESDSRSLPFAVAPRQPRVLIIGAAGGHEVQASLYFDAAHVTAVELNPPTVYLVTELFADYVGRLAENPRVNYFEGEGRSFLMRDKGVYDLIYFVAPDSYASMNSASSNAFVLSESYLYTVEMVIQSLGHLSDGGVICMQFGEYSYATRPLRTARYLATAREAFRRLGIPDFEKHVAVLTQPAFPCELSTIVVGKSPFTGDGVQALVERVKKVEGGICRYVPGQRAEPDPVTNEIVLPDASLASWLSDLPYDMTPVTDDRPFFWHFLRFRDTFEGRGSFFIGLDESVGNEMLFLLLGISGVLALLVLGLPFVLIRKTWGALPCKLPSLVYFAALGLGFMFFEITLIQKFTLFLGYPTRSLSVTLMALLLSTGVGSFWATWYGGRIWKVAFVLLGMMVLLTGFYGFGVGPLMNALVGLPVAFRVLLSVVFIAPLGICMGAFMPTGLRAVSGLTDHQTEYVAWAWAVNGFFSVIGSVLSTMLAMSFGFRMVLLVALGTYAIGVTALARIPDRRPC